MQVVVAGCGPAGLSVAAACCAAGLDVQVVAPDADHAWTNTYGAWLDELSACGVGDMCTAIWPRAAVWTGKGDPIIVQRAYARVDGGRLREHLMARSAGARFLRRSVVSTAADDGGVELKLDDGRLLRAAAFVDARGAASGTDAPRWRHAQTAFGVLCDATNVPWPTDAMCLMDWRSAPDDGVATPSFVYAMPMGGDRWFFEETVLTSCPPVPVGVLRSRLLSRLAALGVQHGPALETERCVIPMDVPLARARGRVVRVGAAGGWVHPATGYSLTLSLRRAERVAEAVARCVRTGEQIDEGMIITSSERAGHRLLGFGGVVAASLNADEIRMFFDAFFRAPADAQRAWLSGDAAAPDVARAMRQIFALLPWPLRIKVGWAGALRAGELASALGRAPAQHWGPHDARA